MLFYGKHTLRIALCSRYLEEISIFETTNFLMPIHTFSLRKLFLHSPLFDKGTVSSTSFLFIRLDNLLTDLSAIHEIKLFWSYFR